MQAPINRFPVMVVGRLAGTSEPEVHFTPYCNWPVPELAVVVIDAAHLLPESATTVTVLAVLK